MIERIPSSFPNRSAPAIVISAFRNIGPAGLSVSGERQHRADARQEYRTPLCNEEESGARQS
jgi:hypothetical protein